jgi:hypothetical protein
LRSICLACFICLTCTTPPVHATWLFSRLPPCITIGIRRRGTISIYSFASHRQGDDASASTWAWFAWRLGASTASLVTFYISGTSALEKRPAPILFSQYTIHEEKGYTAPSNIDNRTSSLIMSYHTQPFITGAYIDPQGQTQSQNPLDPCYQNETLMKRVCLVPSSKALICRSANRSSGSGYPICDAASAVTPRGLLTSFSM